MKRLPIIRRNEGITDGPCNRRGAKVRVASAVHRTSPALIVPVTEDCFLQDPDGFPIADPDNSLIYVCP